MWCRRVGFHDIGVWRKERPFNRKVTKNRADRGYLTGKLTRHSIAIRVESHWKYNLHFRNLTGGGISRNSWLQKFLTNIAKIRR